ncbi:MAG: NapC/NirT family cytochrome c [Geminicoccaceae bacterium]
MMRRLWNWFWTPAARWSLGGLLILGFVGGIAFWGSFNWAMEMTNNEPFCVSCHEMYDNVYQEYRETVHFSNRSGVRASCPDCHVPKEWVHKVIRKVQATNELYHKFIDPSIDTPEKFEAERLRMAKNVWYAMKTTDSRECRNCHKFDYMDLTLQEARSSSNHEQALADGKTCIDCHRGIAHDLPEDAFQVDLDQLVAERGR